MIIILNLYVVRHGQTEWNVKKRIQGRKDSELTAKGIQDAKLLGTRLKDMDWTAVYASPSKRAVTTASLITKNDSLHIQTDKRLLEMDLGNLEGLTMEEIKGENAKQHHHYWNSPSQFFNPPGESFVDVKNRIEQFTADLGKKYDKGNILIVTHGVVIKMLQVICSGLQIDDIWETPFITWGSLTKIQVNDGSMNTILAGDISHMDDEAE